jgi:L-malate glycosyltransferase
MKKPIKVLHFTTLLKGAAYFNNLHDYTDAEKVKHIYATFTKEGDFSAQLEERGATVYKLNITKKDEDIAWADMPKAYKPLVDIIEKEEIDIVHPHLIFPTLLGLSVARLKGKKTVFTRHHSDAVHVLESTIKRKFYMTIERYNNRMANHIIAPSRTVRDILVEKEGVSAEKVSLIPYGQTFERFAKVTPEIVKSKREELGMNEQLSMVCVSRLFYTKGHTYLFEALAPLFKNGLKAKLYIVGTGDYGSTLEAKVKELDIQSSVVFLGWRDDVLPIIASSDMVVHPSLEDALSQSLIESLMLERPIVATDISGAGDTLGDGKYGRLVNPADSEDLRKGIEETITNIAEARKKAIAGREFLLDYMSAEKCSLQYEKIYENLMTA